MTELSSSGISTNPGVSQGHRPFSPLTTEPNGGRITSHFHLFYSCHGRIVLLTEELDLEVFCGRLRKESGRKRKSKTLTTSRWVAWAETAVRWRACINVEDGSAAGHLGGV